jgi:hypothetical protein
MLFVAVELFQEKEAALNNLHGDDSAADCVRVSRLVARMALVHFLTFAMTSGA